MNGQHIGQILWTDLTVENADGVRAFYEAVIGWTSDSLSMGDYDDFMMLSKSQPLPKSASEASCVAGICHARGDNGDMPAQWLNYFGVADLDQSRAAVEAHGGKVLTKIKAFGDDRFCAIADPAGAVCGLYEKAAKSG